MLSMFQQHKLFVQVFKGWGILIPFCLLSTLHKGNKKFMLYEYFCPTIFGEFLCKNFLVKRRIS